MRTLPRHPYLRMIKLKVMFILAFATTSGPLAQHPRRPEPSVTQRPTLQRIRTIAAVTTIAAIALVTPAASATAQHPTHKDKIAISGQIEHRRTTTTFANLRALPQHTLTVTFSSGTGDQTHTGPLLLDVATAAHPRFDTAVKNDQLRFFVAATAGDAYRAIVSWGEIDPRFAGTEVLLAITEDGQPLDDAGPRLVVPGDTEGGRYVSGITKLYIGSVDRLVGG